MPNLQVGAAIKVEGTGCGARTNAPKTTAASIVKRRPKRLFETARGMVRDFCVLFAFRVIGVKRGNFDLAAICFLHRAAIQLSLDIRRVAVHMMIREREISDVAPEVAQRQAIRIMRVEIHKSYSRAQDQLCTGMLVVAEQ